LTGVSGVTSDMAIIEDRYKIIQIVKFDFLTETNHCIVMSGGYGQIDFRIFLNNWVP